jgi:methylmalonyl-CoA/ethylmalonyl-CoA epimerase
MKILKIDHIGIAAKSIDQVAPFWNVILGLPIAGRETVQEQKATTAFLPVGESELEIL